jgi:hypothetical protein
VRRDDDDDDAQCTEEEEEGLPVRPRPSLDGAGAMRGVSSTPRPLASPVPPPPPPPAAAAA